jgi:glycerol-3-phosphate dehydrogenase (NAD(P)+)
VEGINALPAAMELAEKYHVEMPIAQTVNAIVKEGMSASDALRNLMSRDRKSEMPQGYEGV